MATHELKTWPEYFQAVKIGDKTFELRKDDRSYAIGDILVLREYEPATDTYTGDVCRRRVLYVLRGGPWLSPGYVALGISLLEARQ